ncbi:MAG: hypothetical protein Q8M03_07150, partial [Legionella sp.]|nr:hypothetical protein [Legionella sp.]
MISPNLKSGNQSVSILCKEMFSKVGFLLSIISLCIFVHGRDELSNIHIQVASRHTLEKAPPKGEMIRIAILVPTHSHSIYPDIKSSPIFAHLLPSLNLFLEPQYEYCLYVAHDKNDLPYQSQHNSIYHEIAMAFLEETHNKGLHTHLIFLDFDNTQHGPGPAMNYIALSAHADGADYFFRINDDTELKNHFTSKFIATLLSFNPPNLGVVGPLCRQGNTAILTHDFVHSTHIDIFGYYYPVQLTDWWLDDWITKIYEAIDRKVVLQD